MKKQRYFVDRFRIVQLSKNPYLCAPMRRNFIFYILISLVVLSVSSCKTEFEKIRAGNDATLIYEKAFEYYEKEDYVKAQTLFEIIIGSLRGQSEAEKVYFYYANTHYKLRKYILASYYYKNFATTFPNSQYREEAEFMSAYSNYELSPTYRLDQTYSLKAVDEFQLFANTYPGSDRVPKANKIIDEIRDKMETKAYYEAELYYDLRQYQSATHCFDNMLKDYPDSDNAEKVRYMIVVANFDFAENSIYEKRSERYQNTIQRAQDFLLKYPSSSYAKEVKSIKNNSEKKLKTYS